VLWRDAQQQWRAFEDRCPHRLAPLSGARPFQAIRWCAECAGRLQSSNGSAHRAPQSGLPSFTSISVDGIIIVIMEGYHIDHAGRFRIMLHNAALDAEHGWADGRIRSNKVFNCCNF
jgi:phenylpropionate dioxygenase-like ring-hydroxylating dioxygenase large terminal subunit